MQTQTQIDSPIYMFEVVHNCTELQHCTDGGKGCRDGVASPMIPRTIPLDTPLPKLSSVILLSELKHDVGLAVH